MGGGFPNPYSDQSHVTVAFCQTELAFHFHPLTFIPVNLSFTSSLIFSVPPQRRTGTSDSVCYSIDKIILFTVTRVRQDATWITPFLLPKTFCHFLKIPGHVIGIKGVKLQQCPPIHNADIRFCPKLHQLFCFLTHNELAKLLTDTDDPVRDTMGAVIVHVYSVMHDGTNCIHPLCLPHSQILSVRTLAAINGIEVPPEVTQLFSNGFAGRFSGIVAASRVFQVISLSVSGVGMGFLSLRRITKEIQRFFSVFSDLIEQWNILSGQMLGDAHVASTIIVPLYSPASNWPAELSLSFLHLASFI